MDYRLELLDESKFEKLVNVICQRILGIGVIAYAEGRDGGRDGKFIGIADNFPSKSKPWSGKFIIQSKHTLSPIASCSESQFENQILSIEVPKIIKLVWAGELDNYILFTNRKYSGDKGERLLAKLKKLTNLDNVEIIGKETINNLYLNQHKDIVKLFELDKHHIPFDFSDEDIKNIIVEFRKQLPDITIDLANKVEKSKYDFDKIGIVEKNEKNKLGEDYFMNVIKAKSLMEFDKIQYFLENDINSEFKDYYYDIVSELSGMIVLKRTNFAVFEEIFIFIYQKITDGNNELKGSKRHVLTLLHYMYMNCEIGLK